MHLRSLCYLLASAFEFCVYWYQEGQPYSAVIISGVYIEAAKVKA